VADSAPLALLSEILFQDTNKRTKGDRAIDWYVSASVHCVESIHKYISRQELSLQRRTKQMLCQLSYQRHLLLYIGIGTKIS
jgi:hypothetical protein